MRAKRLNILRVLRITAMAVLILPVAAHAGVPYPDAATPKAIDLGPLSAQPAVAPISVTIALRLSNLDDAENLLKSINNPEDPQYHKFLTAEQFVDRFAPADADVAKVVASLASYGLTAERTTATTLKVTGMPADVERTFAVSLHSYAVAAHGNAEAYTFHAPTGHPTIPAEISEAVAAVVGLDDRPPLHPYHRAAPATIRRAPLNALPSSSGNTSGNLTVVDFAKEYDVEPLYQRGISGVGRTLGIITFASFTTSDVFGYWTSLKLSVSKSRITIHNIDGGPGKPSDASGSIETTLDVEQSGGVAPGAKIIVYQAPNTNQGFVNNFAAAIDSNTAETLSCSWGEWEWFYELENSPVIDPATGKKVGVTEAVHELLVRAAIQGQTIFIASGDGGAYEANDDLGCYGPYSSKNAASCSLTLSVGYPGSDPAATAAGGTTLPGSQQYCVGTKCTTLYTINIPQQRVWGWDYLDGLCKAQGTPSPITCQIFPAGSGGGVSISFDLPHYQDGLSGIQRSQPEQVFRAGKVYASESALYYAVPSQYQGRNVPDISFNADPNTGYEIYYTSNLNGFGIATYYGGTSFVAPQLNGVSALLGQYLHSRIGLLNYPLYNLAVSGRAYSGSAPPMHPIAEGDNWFYHGRNSYNPAAGLGTLDVFNFAEFLRGEF